VDALPKRHDPYHESFAARVGFLRALCVGAKAVEASETTTMSESRGSPPESVEAELDRLFQVSTASFVAERNKHAQALRSAGDRAAAEAVGR
jgi:hypothetical protein